MVKNYIPAKNMICVLPLFMNLFVYILQIYYVSCIFHTAKVFSLFSFLKEKIGLL
jgi:hypothetical protein